MNLPPLGLGTWGMGGKFERDDSNVDASIAAIRYAVSRGITLFDTAELYGEGLTESIMGEAFSEVPRSTLFLVSKVWKTNLRYNDVLKSVRESCKRLRTDYLDLYLMHYPNPAIPLTETMRALEELVQEKIVRAIGASNFDAPLLKEAVSCLKNTKIAVNQIEYNLTARQAEKEMIPYCRTNDIKVMAYRPLARGELGVAQNENVNALAKKHGKTPAQIALSWLMGQETIPIPKAMEPRHIDEIAACLTWRLPPDDIRLLSELPL